MYCIWYIWYTWYVYIRIPNASNRVYRKLDRGVYVAGRIYTASNANIYAYCGLKGRVTSHRKLYTTGKLIIRFGNWSGADNVYRECGVSESSLNIGRSGER